MNVGATDGMIPADKHKQNMTPPLLRVVVFEGLRGTWVAQALEYDIAAEGPSTEGAVEAVLRILQARVDFARRHNREPLSDSCAAPRHYWNAFAQATPLESQWLHRDPQPAIPGRVIAAIAHERPPLSR